MKLSIISFIIIISTLNILCENAESDCFNNDGNFNKEDLITEFGYKKGFKLFKSIEKTKLKILLDKSCKKTIKMIKNFKNIDKFITFINNTDINNLKYLVSNVKEINLLVKFIESFDLKVIKNKLCYIINQLTNNGISLFAKLLNEENYYKGGLGYKNVATIINNFGKCLSSTQSVSEFSSNECLTSNNSWDSFDKSSLEVLSRLLNELNEFVCYLESCGSSSLPSLEGLVRFISYGTYFLPNNMNILFVGIGVEHFSYIINKSAINEFIIYNSYSLLYWLNNYDLTDLVIIISCGDHLEKSKYACTKIGEGW